VPAPTRATATAGARGVTPTAPTPSPASPAATTESRLRLTDYIDEYYDGVRDWDDATPVGVIEGQNTSGIDFSLDLGGTISGVVTDTQGDPIEGAWVVASPTIASGTVYAAAISPPPFPPGGGSSSTNSDGEYTIGGLATGAYIVSAGGDGYQTRILRRRGERGTTRRPWCRRGGGHAGHRL